MVPKRCPSAERPRTYLTIYSVFVNDELLCSQLKKNIIWHMARRCVGVCVTVFASRCSRHGVRVDGGKRGTREYGLATGVCI